MRIMLRCAGKPDTSAGSLARGVAVAEAAMARGHEVLLSASVHEDWTRELVSAGGVDLVPPATSADELRALAVEHGAHLVHLDGPSMEGAEALSGNGLRLSRLDEWAAADALADLLVAPTFDLGTNGAGTNGAGPDLAASQPPVGQIIVRGPEYAPLRAAVLAARERRQDRAGGMGDRLRVFVRLGSVASAERMLPVVQALTQSDLTLDVLALAPTPAIGMRAEALSNRRVRVLATVRRADLPRLVADHDLVVTRPGHIVWELCCIGAPIALVTRTDADVEAAAGWVKAGVAVSLGPVPSDGSLAGPLRALLRDGWRRAELGTTGLRVVDGAGADRIAALMERVVDGQLP